IESCVHLSLGAHSTKINATAWQSRSCAIASHVAFSRKTRNFAPFLGILPPFCKPIGFESGRGQPLSGTQGKRVATFALVTTVGPQPRPARSTPGEPGRAANRQALASLSCPANRQVLRNPHVGQPGFLSVNEHTPAHRRSAWATRGLASQTELPKMVGTIPTDIVYDNVTQCFGQNPCPGH